MKLLFRSESAKKAGLNGESGLILFVVGGYDYILRL